MYIQIKPGGRTTDQIIRYAVALYIQKKFPSAQIVNYENTEWCIQTPEVDISPDAGFPVGRAEIHNIDEILKEKPESIVITWPVLDLKIFQSARLELVNQLSKIPQNNFGNRALAEDEILIHLRLGDVTNFVHRDYWPLPIKFYKELCEKEQLKPVFIGELFKHPGYLEQIQKIIPSARMIPPGSVMEDFLRVKTAKNIVLSLSSFAWLAAWLSDTAEKIHMPYCGIFSELRRPDVRLRDPNDGRFRYHILPNLNWKKTPDVLTRNLEVECKSIGFSENVTLWEETPVKFSASDKFRLNVQRLKRHISR